MDELISTGKILFVIFFIVCSLIGVVFLAKRFILAGASLLSLSLFLLVLVFWSMEFDKLGWTPLWIFIGLLVLSVTAWFVAPKLNLDLTDSDDTSNG